MKISKSKQELARIISENGGWQEHCEWAVQDKSGEFGENSVILFEGKDMPVIEAGQSEWMCAEGCESDSFFGKHVCDADKLVKNWHQTILSRKEYFHMYHAADAKAEFCESVTRSIPCPETKPTIEQLAADYRNRKDYADRKQEEADAAKADADAKLAELVAAGKELGLIPASAVKPAIDGCMQLVDMVPTRLQCHQEESVAAIGHVVNVERLYDKVRDAFDLLK